jgi:hypothetical protein
MNNMSRRRFFHAAKEPRLDVLRNERRMGTLQRLKASAVVQ